MSDSFVVAARVPLAKKKVTAWLRTPWPASPAMGAMFEGRGWAGRDGLTWTPRGKAVPKTVRHFFASVADGVCEGQGGLVLTWDGRAKCVWLHQLSIGLDEVRIAGALTALSAAASHLAAKKSFDVILTAEPSGRLAADGVLAVMHVDGSGARFEPTLDPAPVVATLAPVEERFVAALGAGLDVAMRDPAVLHPQVRQLAKSPTLKKTAWKVPELESAKAFLDAVSRVRFIQGAKDPPPHHFASYGAFEKSIARYAEQAPRFGRAIVEPLREMLAGPEFEPGVVAFWSLNRLAVALEEPALYVDALRRFAEWEHGHQGTVRGEVTAEDVAARADHREALRGSELEGRSIVQALGKFRSRR